MDTAGEPGPQVVTALELLNPTYSAASSSSRSVSTARFYEDKQLLAEMKLWVASFTGGYACMGSKVPIDAALQQVDRSLLMSFCWGGGCVITGTMKR